MKIMLVDDHEAMRTQLRDLVSAEADMSIVAEAESGEESIMLARECLPEVVVMDIMMPGINGIEATRRILAEHPTIRVLALSNHSGATLVKAILDVGGLGYVPKSRAFEELIPAIRCVASGRRYVTPDGAIRESSR